VLLAIVDGEDKSSPLKNCIRKKYRHLRKWAKRTKTDCFRIYDRDSKEYPLAIDYYAGHFCVHFFSYQRDELTDALKNEVHAILWALFGVTESSIFWRSRIKRQRTEQYEKVGKVGTFFTVQEYGVQFKVNLQDYLDTGLFLDHRETRQRVAKLAKGKRLLNLFAYTCSFSVQAAMKGATYTKSVDLSNTYTAWGKENFRVNALSLADHEVIVADCLQFIEQEQDSYDVIVIDPPTLSRSKKMEQMFDVQQDYIFLITQALRLLRAEGVLFFSTNARGFTFDSSYFKNCFIEEISEKTVPEDFHNKKIHRCWEFRL